MLKLKLSEYVCKDFFFKILILNISARVSVPASERVSWYNVIMNFYIHIKETAMSYLTRIFPDISMFSILI